MWCLHDSIIALLRRVVALVVTNMFEVSFTVSRGVGLSLSMVTSMSMVLAPHLLDTVQSHAVPILTMCAVIVTVFLLGRWSAPGLVDDGKRDMGTQTDFADFATAIPIGVPATGVHRYWVNTRSKCLHGRATFPSHAGIDVIAVTPCRHQGCWR